MSLFTEYEFSKCVKRYNGTTRNAVYTIGQILFKRGDIRDFYNKPDEPVNALEDDSNRQFTLW